MVLEADVVNVTDHVHVHETVLPRPHGEQFVAMTTDEDINVLGMVKKNEMYFADKASGIAVATKTSVHSRFRQDRSKATASTDLMTKAWIRARRDLRMLLIRIKCMDVYLPFACQV